MSVSRWFISRRSVAGKTSGFSQAMAALVGNRLVGICHCRL